MSVLVILGLVAVGGIAFMFLLWKWYLNPKNHWDELYEMLRSRGIGDRPQSIVKRFYELQHKHYTEKEIRKLTTQFLYNNKEFFLTMYDTIANANRNEK